MTLLTAHKFPKGGAEMRTEAIPMEELAQILSVQLQYGAAPLRVTGSSMHPTFRHRLDTVMLRAFDDRLKRGDVVLFRREEGSYILHRVISKPGEKGFFCAGDNQHVAEWVSLWQVLAVVESFQRGGKHVRSTDFGYRLFVWIWLLLFPIRRPILAVRRFLGCLRRRIRR